ncbi:unnamed protein product [Paramecium pentaurelia]|uniref:GTPase Der n=1 Tax=Paramecium pentaurelia TaxID=43138 RepID=A0A8S1XKV9_9CILI|nr:unnamed protein product [Paramecium pentaurelia]
MFTKILYKFSQTPLLTISLIGRSSVGKSSLFNKLQTGENVAITSNQKNITRDRKEAISEIFPLPIRFVDTAGIENVALKKILNPLQQKMLMQTINAIEYSDIALFVVDAKAGLTNIDHQIARWLKKTLQLTNPDPKLVNELKELEIKTNLKKAILVANKCENDVIFETDIDSQLKRMGLGNPIYVSAVDGTGFQDLLTKISENIPQAAFEEHQERKLKRKEKYKEIKEKCRQEMEEVIQQQQIEFDMKIWEKEFDLANPNPEDNSDLDDENIANPIYTKSPIQEKQGVSKENLQLRNPIMLSIMGRQNVGKSSLVNTLLGEDRVIADPTPGTTRDPISTYWVYKGQKIQLVDTAGIEPKPKIQTDLDLQIIAKTRSTLRFSNVVVLLIDSLGAFREVDLELAQEIVKQGRGLIIAVNKWDMVDNDYKAKIVKYLKGQLEKNLGEVPNCKLITISAEKKINIDLLMDQVIQVYDKWNTRVSTGLLNDWLNKFKKIQSLPSEDGDKLKIRFIAQIKVRPPTFALFINQGSLFKNSYLKFLRKKLSEEFDISGVPIRLVLRDIAYAKEKKTLERDNEMTVADLLLKRRRIARLAKQKLEKLKQKSQANKQ